MTRYKTLNSLFLGTLGLLLTAMSCNGERLASFELTLPSSVAEGQTFELTVMAVGSRGSEPLVTFDGTVELTVSSGTITPASLPLTSGTGTVDATVTGATGEVIVTATHDNVSGSAQVTLTPDATADQLPGDPDDLAAEAIPRQDFEPRADVYSDDHPELGGMLISHNTLLLVFTLETSVAEANAILADIEAQIIGGMPGVAGQAPGILVVRVQTGNHPELIALIETLEQHPNVEIVVQDSLLQEPVPAQESDEAVRPQMIPGPNSGIPADWTWEPIPDGGNWGMELIRAPQMWNLNAAIEQRGSATATGVLDTGFAESHKDLEYSSIVSEEERAHGTHVAGTVAATFDNGVGVDGVTPFAELHARARDTISSDGNWFRSAGQVHIFSFAELINDHPEVRVVNISLGYNWAGNAGIDSDINTAAQRIANRHGALFGLGQLIRVATGDELPVVVASAGNDSNHPNLPPTAGTKDAKYASPFNNAALEHDIANVIVVESLANDTSSPGGATRSGFSNVNGHVSAPGSAVLSTVLSDNYDYNWGTSFAAPHVTGLVSYLYSLDPDLPRPTLTSNPILDILQDSAVPVAGGASDRIDAFAAVLQLDAYRGFPNVLEQLLDIDDGTLDGNQRVQFGTDIDFTVEDGEYDGNIDMADFRRWRDWLLQVENDPALDLDGSEDHPKKDVNGNGLVGMPSEENLYPRGDFNGDGRLSRTAKAFVPGQFNRDMTDLEVLQSRFDDSHYNAADLPELIDSGDIHVHGSTCLEQPDPDVGEVATIRSSISVSGEALLLDIRTHDLSAPYHIYTVPEGEAYVVRADALDSEGRSVASAVETFTVTLGGDTYWDVECTAEPSGESPDATITNPPEDVECCDLDYQYDGFDEERGMWYKDVTLEGAASDPEDGTLTGDALVWTTDRSDLQDINLGTGETITARLYSDVCTGLEHQITLIVTDSDGNTATDVRRIWIWQVC